MTFAEASARYPYDPTVARNPERFHGLAKMGAFDDDGMRRSVYFLFTGKRPERSASPTAESNAAGSDRDSKERQRPDDSDHTQELRGGRQEESTGELDTRTRVAGDVP